MPTTPRGKMHRFFPLLMSFMRIATSRTEPIDSRALGLSDTIGEHYRNDMFLKSPGTSVVPDARLQSRPVMGHYRQTNENYDFGASDKGARKFFTGPTGTPQIDALDYFYDIAFEDFASDRLDVYIPFDADELTETKSEPTNNELNDLSTFLTTLLRQPTWESPLVIVNEPAFPIDTEESQSKGSTNNAELRPNVSKRSRYYRQYPYKHQNARYHNAYDYDVAYFCMPSRNDIFHLLDALHELRQGDRARNVHFCNRRRTARTLLSHVRFIGRRK